MSRITLIAVCFCSLLASSVIFIAARDKLNSMPNWHGFDVPPGGLGGCEVIDLGMASTRDDKTLAAMRPRLLGNVMDLAKDKHITSNAFIAVDSGGKIQALVYRDIYDNKLPAGLADNIRKVFDQAKENQDR